VTPGNNPANIRRAEAARWHAYLREHEYWTGKAREELRQNTERWRERGGQAPVPAEYPADLTHFAELYPDNIRFTGTLPELEEMVTRGLPRGRPYIHDPATWPAVRARAVAKIRRRRAGANYPSRARIAAVLGVAEKTVYNYDAATRKRRP